MSESTAPSGSSPATSANDRILFLASFLTLIAAGIGFGIRTTILKDWGQQFGFTQSELGAITGGGLAGFGLAIIFFSFLADVFGYGKLMLVAFLLHVSSAVLMFAATPVYESMGRQPAYNCLYYGMLLFALGNGTCEAVINPLTATLFPKNKTHWLNILHAGWPLGLILGAMIALGFNELVGSVRWEFKLATFLIPVFLYGLMMFNRRFPDSEAASAGVKLPEMMGTVGMLGSAVAIGLIGLFMADQLPKISADIPPWAGWAVALLLWLTYGAYTRFAPGSLLIASLYVLHAMVGYVELGTDSWITNITTTVLNDESKALLVFIWTNALMFTLRFFAGPIVHRINPIGLLLVSAIFGTVGLVMLGLPFTDSVWPWVAAVTIYGIGKTFYWPTLLGVVSERFPKGGALALGLSGGIGMLSAGLLGGPGIGYKQDYFAADKLKELDPTTYERYKSDQQSQFPILTSLVPNTIPPVHGLNNAYLKVFDDYDAHVKKVEQAKKDGAELPAGPKTTLEAELETLQKEKDAGKPVEPQREKTLTDLRKWWATYGEPFYEQDKDKIPEAKNYAAKTALLYTAIVPAGLIFGFLCLLVYFNERGGYKAVQISDPHGGMSLESTPE